MTGSLRLLANVAAGRLNAANGAIVHFEREPLAAALSIPGGARDHASATCGAGGA